MEGSSLEEMKDIPSEKVAKEFATFPKRPSIPQTPSGSIVKLSTNFFRMIPKPSNYVFVYSVKFEPFIPDDNTPLRKRIIRGISEILEHSFKKFIFTGTVMYSTFDSGATPIIQETACADIKYSVTFFKVYVISLEDIRHPHKDMAKAQTANTFFNILIKSLLQSLNMVPVGRTSRYLIPSEAVPMNDYKLQIWPGYKTSVRLCEGGLLLEIDYTSRILSLKSALEVIEEIKRSGSKNVQGDVKEYFKARSVIAWYGNKRNYVIDDVEFNLNPDTYNFPTPEGPMNVTVYMKKKYGIVIKHRNQPLLLHLKKNKGEKEASEKIYLVPEICGLTGLPDEIRNDFHAMRQIAVHTKLTPDQRTDKMERLLKLFNRMDIDRTRKEGEAVSKRKVDQPAEILRRWGFEIDSQPIQVQGRKLVPVKIALGRDETMDVPSNGQFFFKKQIVSPLSLDKWILVHDNRGRKTAEDFVNTLYEASKTFGIHIDYPEYEEISNTRAKGFIDGIKNALKRVKDPQVILCMLPRNAVNEYKEIKRWAITQPNPYLTQMVKVDTLTRAKNMMPICSKVILQINSKRNGDLWRVSPPKELPKKTMMVGIDVSREARKTYLGFASSYNPTFTKYYTQITKLAERAEISGTIGILLYNALMRFYRETKNAFFPELIVIYRDGVGDSQKHEVFCSEVESIFKVLSTKLPDYKPKLLFAVINKKVHTRFFKKDTGGGQSHGGRSRGRRGYAEEEKRALSNPDPGTVIHSDIIDSRLYEFLIMPQYVNEGTGTPVRVHVIYDTSGLSFAGFEDLTNSLCYGYDNWQGAIRVPAPCKYAFTHAKLAAKYTDVIPTESLLSNKYFL